jgi:hypothetical protein
MITLARGMGYMGHLLKWPSRSNHMPISSVEIMYLCLARCAKCWLTCSKKSCQAYKKSWETFRQSRVGQDCFSAKQHSVRPRGGETTLLQITEHFQYRSAATFMTEVSTLTRDWEMLTFASSHHVMYSQG